MSFIIFAGLILPCAMWVCLAQTHRLRGIGAAALLMWAATAMGIVAVLPRARAEVTIVYPAVAAAIILIGRRTERRTLGLAEPQPEEALTTKALLVVGAVVLCCFGPLTYSSLNGDPYLPSDDELSPLPQGLYATEVSTDPSRRCDPGSCTRVFVVTGEPPASMHGLYAQITEHLRSRGWEPDDGEEDCRGTGLLLDTRDLCVKVFVDQGAVHVSWKVRRAWSRA